MYPGETAPPPVEGIPEPDPRVGEGLEWWERFRVSLRAFLPPAADAPFLEVCQRLGLMEPESPYVQLDPEQGAVLTEGAKAGQQKSEELMRQIGATPEGWQVPVHVFDHNLDHFEIGTIDSQEWKAPDRQRAYLMRAVAARAGRLAVLALRPDRRRARR